MATLNYRASCQTYIDKQKYQDVAGMNSFNRSSSVDLKAIGKRSGGDGGLVHMARQRGPRACLLLVVLCILLVLVYRTLFSHQEEKVAIDSDFLSALQKHRIRGTLPEPFSFVPLKMKECTELLNANSAQIIYSHYLARLREFKTHLAGKSVDIGQDDVQSKEKDVIHFGVVKSGYFDVVCTNAITTATDDVLPVLLWPTTSLYVIHAGRSVDAKSSDVLHTLHNKIADRIKVISVDNSGDIAAVEKKCNLVIINAKAPGARTILERTPQLVNPDMHFIAVNNLVPGSALNRAWEKAKGSGQIRNVFSCEFQKVTKHDVYLPTVVSKIAVGRLDPKTLK